MKPAQYHQFSQVPKAEIPRSSFNRSCNLKTTLRAGGFLYPIYVDEMLPGDTFNLKASFFGRLSTPIVPIMDNLYLDCFFFAVPNRLLWQNWQKFNGEQTNPGDSTSYLVPQLVSPGGGAVLYSMWDYFALPINVAGLSVSALPFRAYNLIWNQWFRDQNLQNSINVNTGDGPDTYADYANLQQRGKRHDYFTSSLPFPQKGPAVTIPIAGSAPIKSTNTDAHGRSIANFMYNEASSTLMDIVSSTAGALTAGGSNPTANATPLSWPLTTDGQYNYADLTQATATTINQLRQSFQIQKLYERDARGGTRYTEIIRAHFGVTSPDARLQRPEYLGGGSTPIIFSSVPQTAPTVSGQTPQGNLAAFATVASHGRSGFTYSATEHMTLIGLASVRADLTYQQQIDRMWSRSTRFDFYWPALSHIGEQSVLNKEIYADGSANDALTFGYQERFAEYRYKNSQITGLFRSAATGSIDYWHLAQNFTSLPVLGAAFIADTPPITRVIATPTQPNVLLDVLFNITSARPMPVYSVPGFVDHF